MIKTAIARDFELGSNSQSCASRFGDCDGTKDALAIALQQLGMKLGGGLTNLPRSRVTIG